MSSVSMKIEKFTGRNSFSLWRIKMRALLKNQGCWAPLSKDKKNIGAAEMEALEEKAHSLILLCLADEFVEVSDEETCWFVAKVRDFVHDEISDK